MVALQQGRTLSKHSVVGNDDISDGHQSGRAAPHEEEGQVGEAEGALPPAAEIRDFFLPEIGVRPSGARFA